MTPGDEIAFRIAVGVFVLGLAIFAAWKVIDWRAERRRAARFEARRSPVDRPVDEDTVEIKPYVCPSCKRNAGHDDKCYVRRQERRAAEIKIPRKGEPQ